ncbi:MAG TPA: lysylphosphatidylglycerol synthase transmembrane domain-containing protein [Bacteroidia bacterium]|nr:lysylphosphatidylglycerol synthase transmembrane domain-containing protein [Bacteroidia bacterium]
MNDRLKKIIQYVVLLAIGGLLIYLSIKRTSVSKEELINAFKSSNIWWIAISLVVSFASHFARAYRWNYLLENYNYKVDIVTSTSSVLIGYLANYGLPRMGEISRCAVVAKYNNVPMDIALGTVIAERVVDLLLLFIVFMLVILFQWNDLQLLLNKYILDPLSQKISLSYLIIALILIIASIIIWMKIRKKTDENSNQDFISKILKVIKNLIQPLLSIHKIRHPVGFWIWSIVIWLFYFLSMYFCALSMDSTENLGGFKILVLFLFGTFGVIVTPGGIGAYHFLITELLLFYQIDKASAVAFPWIIWGTQFLLILMTGGLSFILLPIINSKTKN